MTTYCHFGRISARVFCSTLVAGVMLAGISGIAAAASLFGPASDAEVRAAGVSKSDGAKRARLVSLNTRELARIVPLGTDNATNRIARATNLSKTVTIELFPGLTVEAQRNDLEAADGGGYIWVGNGAGQNTSVTLVIAGNEITGQIETGGEVYGIKPVSGGLHRIAELDPSKIVPDIERVIDPKYRTKAPKAKADPKAVTEIKLLVAHTVKVRQAQGGTLSQQNTRINADTNLAVNKLKQALTASKAGASHTRGRG